MTGRRHRRANWIVASTGSHFLLDYPPLDSKQLAYQRRYQPDLQSLRLTSVIFYLWMIIFTAQAHKEERFLFPIYPLICLLAAIGLVQLKSYLLGKWLTMSFCTIFVLLSLSRVLAIYTGKLFSSALSLKRFMFVFCF